jgi:4-amino-4-deoxy-L-arabinose transferase-like glycosyltransferase
MKEFIRKYRLFIVLGVILVLGVFLRSYNFSDWLHFELDQSRDAVVVDLAVEQGVGNLPLLGPKAAGSFLRLGPAFYNFEYLSALIFGKTPEGMAAHNLIFSILALPLFYLFMRRYFNQKISLSLLLLFSSSLFLVLYSRFGWNPNSLPFFILLAFYGLLRSVDHEEKNKGWWLILSAFSLAILTQLHFVAFLGIPTIVFLFLVIKRPRIKWAYWLGAFLIIITLYLPLIINDFKTGGDNIKEFSKVFAKKSSSGENTLLEKGFRNYNENALGYLLMTTSYQKAELPKLKQTGAKFNAVCDGGCRDGLLFGGIALLGFSLGILLLLLRLKKALSPLQSLLKKEKSSPANDFIILSSLWFGVSFLLFIPIAYDFAPRFFLIVFALPFVFLGLTLQFLEEKIKHRNLFLIVFATIIILLFCANLLAVKNRFSELARTSKENFEIKPDRILKEKYRVTLGQQRLVVNYIENIHNQNGFPVYLNSEAFYRRSLLYLLGEKGIPHDDFRNSQLSDLIFRQGNYFLVYPLNVNLKNRTKKYLTNYEIISQKNFGTLTVIQLEPKKESVNAEKQIFAPEKKPRSSSGVPVRCRWNEILGECNPDELEDGEVE